MRKAKVTLTIVCDTQSEATEIAVAIQNLCGAHRDLLNSADTLRRTLTGCSLQEFTVEKLK